MTRAALSFVIAAACVACTAEDWGFGGDDDEDGEHGFESPTAPTRNYPSVEGCISIVWTEEWDWSPCPAAGYHNFEFVNSCGLRVRVRWRDNGHGTSKAEVDRLTATEGADQAATLAAYGRRDSHVYCPGPPGPYVSSCHHHPDGNACRTWRPRQ